MSLWGQPVFSQVLAGGYFGLITLMWLGLVLGIGGWGRRWTLARPGEETAPPGGRVSICIPARNEVANIETCVRSALASRWPDLEVVVVDDRSDDGTGEAAAAAGAGDTRLCVMRGTEPPPGWAGKVWACHRAGREASGTILLFLDADVRLDPDAVRGLVGELRQRRLTLLSVFGTWSLQSFWERAVIPTVGWLIRGAVDLDRVNDPVRLEAFANGQLILVDREAYEVVGGHGAVSGQILDDVRLAQAFKRRAQPIGLFVAPWAFEVRLYRSLREIVNGYTKNLYEGMGRRPAVGLGAVLFIFVGTLFPHLALLAGIAARLALGWGVPAWPWIAWMLVICLLQVIFRWRADRRDGRSGRDAWVHPIANAILVWILLRSVFGVEAHWKGRRYLDGRAG